MNAKTMRHSILFYSDDDFRSGCRNVSHHYRQQSCSGLHSPGRSNYTITCSMKNKVYQLKVGNLSFPVYCHLGGTDLGPYGAGGWTLVMKIDGSKGTFHCGSNLWRNNQTFNSARGQTCFDTEETKLPTYRGMPFTKICLGIKISQRQRFIPVENSLYSLIADGKY
ncbi:unnamed protein product [Pocillopora meandrina]|uniref:Uncharacterized protein n=1 Tax=Pocillopora meandrina TaxID=46732 RepID=A0AAU9W0A5_9CNID|nr:unnamed protein product [Pocillopora meandrina]